MNYKSEYSERAKKELIQSWIWYENQQALLGDEFIKTLNNKIKKKKKYPERFPERSRNFREATIKVFPFLIIYRIIKKQKRIIISSIFHTKRNPKKKYRKI